MYIELPGSPSSTTVAPTSKRRSTSIEIRRSRLASERPPKKGVATKNAFRSGELTAISQIYSHCQLEGFGPGECSSDVTSVLVERSHAAARDSRGYAEEVWLSGAWRRQ